MVLILNSNVFISSRKRHFLVLKSFYLTYYLVKWSDGATTRNTEPVYFISRGRDQTVAVPGLLRVNIGPCLMDKSRKPTLSLSDGNKQSNKDLCVIPSPHDDYYFPLTVNSIIER